MLPSSNNHEHTNQATAVESELVDEFGADLLAGSGFESEMPEPDFDEEE